MLPKIPTLNAWTGMSSKIVRACSIKMSASNGKMSSICELSPVTMEVIIGKHWLPIALMEAMSTAMPSVVAGLLAPKDMVKVDLEVVTIE